MRSRGDRGGDASQTNFSDTASAQWVNFFVGIIEKMHFELGNVGVHRHDIVGDVTVDWRAVLWVISCVLEQRHPDSHHHSAFDWLRPVSGLIMRPASMTLTTRLTRNRAIS